MSDNDPKLSKARVQLEQMDLDLNANATMEHKKAIDAMEAMETDQSDPHSDEKGEIKSKRKLHFGDNEKDNCVPGTSGLEKVGL